MIQLPDEPTLAMLEALGYPNFACAQFADALRAIGHEIPEKAEAEQAQVLWLFLRYAVSFGDDWKKYFAEWLDGELAKAKAAPPSVDHHQV
jgi:hypothetical protein